MMHFRISSVKHNCNYNRKIINNILRKKNPKTQRMVDH